MKKYEKPILTAISLSGNDQLCGSCADKGGMTLKDDLDFANIILGDFQFDSNGNGFADAEDFANTFAQGEFDCKRQLNCETYCKFTSQQNIGTLKIAWS